MSLLPGEGCTSEHMSWSRVPGPENFTIFEGTSEIQRMIIGRSVTGLDVL